MSLVIAIHHSPDRYALAADSRSVGDPAGMAHDGAIKAYKLGPYLVGFTGGIVAGQRLMRALGPVLGADGPGCRPHGHRGQVETALVAAFDMVQPTTGSTNPGAYPSTGTDVLVVGPPGIAVMSAEGSIRWVVDSYWAIGCAEGYAMGWLDSRRAIDAHHISDLGLIVEAAAQCYPGVGGDVVVLEVGNGG